MATATRRSKLTTIEEVASTVDPGTTLALGGASHLNRPAALVRELVRRRVHGVTLASIGAGWDADLMIAAGVVDRVLIPNVSGAQHGLAPAYRAATESGELDAPYLDAMSLVAAYLAAGYRHPYHLVHGLEGTDIADEQFFEFLTDSKGVRHRAVKAIVPDVFVLHAEEADEFGNVRYVNGSIADVFTARAARRTVAVVERLISNAEVRNERHLTTIDSGWVSAVVEAPFGAHPTGTASYAADDGHLAGYFEASEARRLGDARAFDEYLAAFVDGPVDEQAYYAAVGGRAVEERLRADVAS